MKCSQKFSHLLPQVKELIGLGYGRCRIAITLGIKESQARALMTYILSGTMDEDNVNVKTMITQSQKLIDKSRARRKETRETARQVGVLEELTTELFKLLKKKNLSHLTVSHDTKDTNKNIGIIHLSDAHFNELINTQCNKYDFNVAAARLRLLAIRAKTYFKALGITDVLLAMTGDMMNSDRRLDEILNAVTNRTKATFLAVDILQQFILDINDDFNVTVAYVSGNESRINPEIGWNPNPVSDSYDTTIFYMLKFLFRDAEGVYFIDGDPSELIVQVGNINILLIHGHGCINGSVERSVEQIKGRYASQGIIVDYVIFGHIHSAYVGDHFSRSSSLCGSNAYNEKKLNIRGRASQNVYIVNNDQKLIDAIKVDLQIIDGEQYNVDMSLAEYNPKSAKKAMPVETIFRVVV